MSGGEIDNRPRTSEILEDAVDSTAWSSWVLHHVRGLQTGAAWLPLSQN